MKLLINIFILLIMSAAWASGYIIIKLEEGTFPPLILVAWRASIAAVAVLGFCLIARQRLKPAFARSGDLLILALFGITALWSGGAFGEEYIGPGLASILVALVPLTTLVITALPPISKHVRGPAWLGAAIATTGLILVVGPEQILHDGSRLIGVVIISGGFMSFGLYCVLTQSMLKGLNPASAAGVTLLYAAIIVWILAFIFESPTAINPSTRSWVYMLLLGVGASAIPNLLIFVLIKRAGAVFASLYGYIMPVFGIILGMIVFGTEPAWTLYLGVPVIFVGLALVQRTQAKTG